MAIRIHTLLLASLLPALAFAQDPMPEADKKNVIKYVFTPNVFYDNAFVMAYERVVRGNQTLNVVAGKIEFPNVFSRNGHIKVDEENSKGGFTAGAEYRFYLKKENKFAAPRGIYIAPFVSYYQFSKDWMLQNASSATSSTASLDGKLSFLNFGGQIGYQFIVKDRVTFDFIFFGPSVTNYRFDLDLKGDFTVDEESEIVRAFIDHFPLLGDLIDDNEVTVHGRNSTWAAGYRFTCMIGYTFGRKR